MASQTLTVRLDSSALTPSGTGLELFRVRTTAKGRELNILSGDLRIRIAMDEITFHLFARHLAELAGRGT